MKNIFTHKRWWATLFFAVIIFSPPSYAKESGVYYGASIEQFEYRLSDKSGESFNWNGSALIGTDEINLEWYASGEINTKSGDKEELENRIMLSKPLSTFFNAKAGVRLDTPSKEEDRLYGVIGMTGLAPQWIEVDADIFFSEKGNTSARLDAEYELLITNYLILQPSVDINFSFSDDKAIGVGSGLNSIEAGLRLSYDLVDRTLSPYIGISLGKTFGKTADMAREEGKDLTNVSFVIGSRFMF
jgi:copper resistance protein B